MDDGTSLGKRFRGCEFMDGYTITHFTQHAFVVHEFAITQRTIQRRFLARSSFTSYSLAFEYSIDNPVKYDIK